VSDAGEKIDWEGAKYNCGGIYTVSTPDVKYGPALRPYKERFLGSMVRITFIQTGLQAITLFTHSLDCLTMRVV
jgi:hypothetical protein